MTRKQQKDKEEIYLNLFIERIFDLKNNKIGIENTEQPDFIIHANNKKIGIEITNLFHKMVVKTHLNKYKWLKEKMF